MAVPYRPPYPPPRKSNTGLIVAAILVVVAIIIAAFVVTTLPKKNNNLPPLVAWPTDSDGDNYPDSLDVFPNDANEWADENDNDIGDNSEAYSPDNDSDGFNDLVDLRDGFDAGILIELDTARIIDDVDWLTGMGNVYFTISINGRQEARIDDHGYPYNLHTAQTHSIQKSLRFNVDDNRRYTKVSIAMVDEDFTTGNDLVDIDEVNLADKTLDIMFDLVNGTWYGDNTDRLADGSLDGTQSSDDDDGALGYDVSVVPISGLKTFNWEYDGDDYELTVDIKAKDYYAYKYSDTERWPGSVSEAIVFVTVSDPVVQEVAGELASMASAEGFNQLQRANFVLAFVQSIDYSYDNASAGANEYWRFPLETLYDETGDCEDTSILYASVMEAMGNDAVLLLLPGHMATGISVPGASGSQSYHVEGSGVNYYYCETTGPGWEVGDVPPQMQGEDADLVIQVPG